MLDYLKENEENQKKLSKQDGSAGGHSATDSKDAKDNEFLTVNTNSKKVQRSTAFLIALFAIGLLGLFFMIKKGAPQEASAETAAVQEAQIDVLIAKLGVVRSELSGRMQKILDKFYELSDPKQVATSELSKNPFKIEGIPGFDAGGGLDSILGEKGVRASDLKLFTIMYSDNGEDLCCMINDKILYSGDVILGFKIESITENTVKVSKDDNSYVLKLGIED